MRNDPLSVFYVLWPSPEPPSEEEIRLSLGPGAREVPATFETDSRPLWSASFAIDPCPAPSLLWAAPNEYLPAAIELDAARVEPATRKAVWDSRWHLGVASALPRGAPLAAWRWHLKTCHLLCPDLGAAFDASAYRLHGAGRVKALLDGSEPLRPLDLFMVHMVLPCRRGGGLWLHTHGLERVGFPDIEMWDVPGGEAQDRGQVINRFVERFLLEGPPPPRSRFELEGGEALCWMPLAQALRGRPEDAHGGRRDRESGTHGGWRIVLVPAAGHVPAT